MVVTVNASYSSTGFNRLVFIMEKGYVLCNIRTELLYEIRNLSVQRVKTVHIGALLLAPTHTHCNSCKDEKCIIEYSSHECGYVYNECFHWCKAGHELKRGWNSVNRILSCGTRTVVILNLIYSECTRTYKTPSGSYSSSSSSTSPPLRIYGLRLSGYRTSSVPFSCQTSVPFDLYCISH